MHGGLWWIPLTSHITQNHPKGTETCHQSQQHRLDWNEAGTGDPSATSQVTQLDQVSGQGKPLWSPQPFQTFPQPRSLGCILFPAQGRTQDPPARRAVLVQSLPPCTMSTRMGRRTSTDPSQGTKRRKVPQSAQDPTCDSHQTNRKAERAALGNSGGFGGA